MIEGTATVGVLIVDDQAPFRDVARTVVALSPGFDVVAEAASGEEAIAAADDRHPQPRADGHQPARASTASRRPARSSTTQPETIVILLSTYTRDDLPEDARAAAARRAYVHKEDFSPLILRETWDEHGPRRDGDLT